MGVKVYKHDKFIGLWGWSSSNFWSKIEVGMELDCWTWRGSMGPQGPLFGGSKLQANGKYKQQMSQARRFLFAEHNGYWLATRQGVYHTCHNKNCMNPYHLSLEPQRNDPSLLKKPGPKPKPKEVPIGRTRIHQAISELNKLNIDCEAN